MNHEHIWVKDTSRIHGRPPRYFVKCSICPATAQAVDTVSVSSEKYCRIFNTGYSHGGPSFQIRGRLKEGYRLKLKRCGKNVAEIVRDYLDSVE